MNADYSSKIWFSHWRQILNWNLAVKNACSIVLHLSISLYILRSIVLNFSQCLSLKNINKNKRPGAIFLWPKYSPQDSHLSHLLLLTLKFLLKFFPCSASLCYLSLGLHLSLSPSSNSLLSLSFSDLDSGPL